MYVIKILDNQEYDSLPYKRARTSVGCADPKTNTAYIRKTGVDIFDLGTIQHEIGELIAKTSPHEEDGIRYKGDEPEYNPPPAPKLKTADEIYQEAIAFALKNYPEAYGAREGALKDIARGNEFYEGFQPTSFEEALGKQQFQNIWPDTQREIAQAYSLSGLEGSPGYGETIGKSYGNIAATIGEYLSNLGNARAQYSLQSRLGIDPNAVTSPYAQTNINQSNQQAQLDYEASVARAQADYQNALAKTKEKQSKVTALTTIGGAAIGAFTGGLGLIGSGGLGGLGIGAAIGAGAGAFSSPFFGGGQSPISFSDALAISQIPQQNKTQDLYNNWLLGNTPTTGTPNAGSVQPVYSDYLSKQQSLPSLGLGYYADSLPTLSQYANSKGLFNW